MIKLILKFALVGSILFSSSCASEQETASNGEVSYNLDGSTVSNNKATVSVFKKEGKYKLNITALEGNEGLLILLSSKKKNFEGTYDLVQVKSKQQTAKNSIKLNNFDDNNLTVLVSELCKASNGSVTITKFDQENNLISGQFKSKLCTGGMFGKFDEVDIVDGVFNDLSFKTFYK